MAIALAIKVYPYRLSKSEMEIRFKSETALLPGQLLRLDSKESKQPVYGEVTGVRVLSAAAGKIARVKLLYGRPSLSLRRATLLSDEEMAHEVQGLQTPENPLCLGNAFVGEFFNLGALTLIEGDSLQLKMEALVMLIQAIEPYQSMLVLDPLGAFPAEDRVCCLRAGEALRLSLQSVGSKRFLELFGDMFPEDLKAPAIAEVAGWMPDHDEFMGFSVFLNHAEELEESPLRNLILQNLKKFADCGVFAEQESSALSFHVLLQEHVNVVDLSGLPEPWKTLFYEEICREVYQNVGGDLVPVMIYAEHYLRDLEHWIQKAEEAELGLVLLTSPYPSKSLMAMSNNLIVVESRERLVIEGELTYGLPVTIPLSKMALAGANEGLAEGAMPEDAPMPVVDLSAPPLEEAPDWTMSDEMSEEMLEEEEEGFGVGAHPEEHPAAYGFAEVPMPEQLSEEETDGPRFELEPQLSGEAGWPLPLPPDEEDEFSFDVDLDEQDPQAIEEALNRYQAQPLPETLPSWNTFETTEEAVAETEPMVDTLASEEAEWTPEESLWAPEEAPSEEVPVSEEASQAYGPDTHTEEEWVAEDSEEELEFPSFDLQPEEISGPVAEAVVPVQAKTLDIETGDYLVGEKVKHEKYGVGIINKIIPMEASVVLNITFEQTGKRLLDPALCKLHKV